jgi:hypothetical protein
MISKVIIGGGSFSGICKYVCGDETRAEVISSNGVRDYNHKASAIDFDFICSQKPGRNKNIFHGILSFPKHEKPSNQLLKQLATEYINELGFSNSPYLVVTHNEKAHFHAHIISSFTQINGAIVERGWIGLRGKKASQRITKKYSLTPAVRKDISQTNLQSLNKQESLKYNLYGIISNTLKVCKDYNQFQALLDNKGVEIKLKYKRESATDVQGISFRYKGFSFKGSSVDRNFSYSKLSKHFSSLSPEPEKQVGVESSKKTFNTHSQMAPMVPSFHFSEFLSDLEGDNKYAEFEDEKLRKKKKRRRL